MTARLLSRSSLIIMQRLCTCSSSLSMHKFEYQHHDRFHKIPRILYTSIAFIIGLFGLNRSQEKIDSALIDSLKRCILMMQRGQYEKAEIALHVALDMAQKQENHNGIIYTFDLMANLAFNRKEYIKAKKLFLRVLQMLKNQGTPINDTKMIHILLKMSKMYVKEKNYKQAKIGYQCCFDQLATLQMTTDDEKLLNALAHSWYAEYLMQINKLEDSITHLKTSYDIVSQIRESPNAEMMIILNDLGFLYFQLGKYAEAQNYLEKAFEIAKQAEIDEFIDVIRANLGLICLYNGSRKKAFSLCTEAMKNAIKSGSGDALEQANYCLNEINEFKKKVQSSART